MKFVIQFVLVVMLLLPSAVSAQPQPPLIAKDGRFQPQSGPYNTFIPYSWSAAPDRRPLLWKNNLPWGSGQYINTAFDTWGNLAGAPDYLEGREVVLLTGSGLIVNDDNVCGAFADACANATSHTLDSTRDSYSVWQWEISYPGYSGDSSSLRQEYITHELGHVLGLHDIEYSGGACDDAYPPTVMSPVWCTNSRDTPTQADSDQLGRLYKFCGGTCGKDAYTYAYFSSGKLRARWDNKVWNSHVALFYYYKWVAGAWVLHSIDQHYTDVGFRYNGITYTTTQYDYITLISDAGNARNRFGQGSLVAICSIPATPQKTAGLYYYGQWDCTGGITIP